MPNFELLHGDCLDVLRTIEDNQFDSIVTDPPYGLSFMGKKWDYNVPSVEIWKECLRVLKPGGHLLAFGGTRTYHRLVVNIEDAGFEIRDQIQWLYGSGFPKSMDISKAIDKEAGAKREVVGTKDGGPDMRGGNFGNDSGQRMVAEITCPATEDAKKWNGWGTSLKPANEPICLARKPLSEKTVAKNVIKHGTGGLNIDASRIESTGFEPNMRDTSNHQSSEESWWNPNAKKKSTDFVTLGRFPANVILDEDAAKVLDEQSGNLKPAGSVAKRKTANGMFGLGHDGGQNTWYADEGGASRFFYVAKASKKDRGEGNIHPTVKPIKLMEYLIKLVTPEGGIVLDPFMGSGTTGVSCLPNGFKFVGIEREKQYMSIVRRRIDNANVRS